MSSLSSTLTQILPWNPLQSRAHRRSLVESLPPPVEILIFTFLSWSEICCIVCPLAIHFCELCSGPFPLRTQTAVDAFAKYRTALIFPQKNSKSKSADPDIDAYGHDVDVDRNNFNWHDSHSTGHLCRRASARAKARSAERQRESRTNAAADRKLIMRHAVASESIMLQADWNEARLQSKCLIPGRSEYSVT